MDLVPIKIDNGEEKAWGLVCGLPRDEVCRATGAGFCFNAGRVLASASPFLTGWLVTEFGSFGRAASTVALIYLVGLAVLLFAPETRNRPLPE